MKHALLALALTLIVAAAVSVMPNDFYVRVVFMICVYYLCAAGMNVLLGYAGQKSLGQAGLFAVGAYAASLLTARAGIDPWIALVLAFLLAALAGVLIALPSLRVKGPSLAMVTLAFGIVVEKLVQQQVDWFGGSAGIIGVKPLYFGSRSMSLEQWVYFALALSLAMHLLLRNLLLGRFGRAFISLRLDEIAASSVGVAVYRYKVLAFVIAAATCGLGGALIAQQNQYINSDFINFNLSIFIFLVVMFGGSSSIYGPLLGASILTVLSAYLARWSWVEHFVNGAILLFALYLMPEGVAGIFRWLTKGNRKAGELAKESPTAAAEQSAPEPSPPPDDKVSAGRGPILTVEGLCKAYGGVRPAKDVNLSVREGHIHALIGPNGAGKTTVLNMLTGVVRPDSGSMLFRGESIVFLAAHEICQRGIARTFQNLKLFDELSVLQNVLLGRHARMRGGFFANLIASRLARSEEGAANRKARELIAFVGLSGLEDLPAGSLPYGLQRRVELARALATGPELLLLDEPAAGLNPGEARQLSGLLQKIRATGISILLVEHHMEVVMGISDRVTVLDYGEIIAEGTAAEVRHDPRVVEAYFGAQSVLPKARTTEGEEPGLVAATLAPSAT